MQHAEHANSSYYEFVDTLNYLQREVRRLTRDVAHLKGEDPRKTAARLNLNPISEYGTSPT